MRIVRYVHEGRPRTGLLDGEVVREVDWRLRDLFVLACAGAADEVRAAGGPVSLDDVQLLPPIEPDAEIYCAGINYAEHQAESADVFSKDIPENPIIFTKAFDALCGAQSELPLSQSVSMEFDYEVELGVVIGAPARHVSEEDAWSVVAGLTVVNDITARDVQVAHSQWTLGKNTAHATPVGPSVVTLDETGADPHLDLELEVNGVLKQSGTTTDMIFGVPALIAAISRSVPLRPGDLIATGTPSGVGFKRQPPEYLRDGDLVVARVPALGTLSNRVRQPTNT